MLKMNKSELKKKKKRKTKQKKTLILQVKNALHYKEDKNRLQLGVAQKFICRKLFCSRKNFKSSFSAGIVLVVGFSNLYILSNEND